MRAWRIAVASLVAIITGLVLLPSSTAQLPPPPTIPGFTVPTFPPPPTMPPFTFPPPPTMPPPTIGPPSTFPPPPTMPPPTIGPPSTFPPPPTMPPPTGPPPTSPPTSIGGNDLDQQIQDIIDQLEELGDGFDGIVEMLRELQSRF